MSDVKNAEALGRVTEALEQLAEESGHAGSLNVSLCAQNPEANIIPAFATKMTWWLSDLNNAEDAERWQNLMTVYMRDVTDFPKHHTLYEQSQFFIGYWKARADRARGSFSVHQAADILDVTPSRIYTLVKEGALPSSDESDGIRIPMNAVLDRLVNPPSAGRRWPSGSED
jgi:hypothetical protein